MKRKFSFKKTIKTLFFIICLILLFTSTIHIIKYLFDSKSSKKQIIEINDKVEIKESKEEAVIIESKEEEKNPYWDFIKLNLIDVDISELKKENGDTVGWIQVKGTNINYPFVQTSNNDYYLTHSFNKTKNSAGWVFLDYRNNIINIDKNTIIYAHGRYDKTMFGTLRNILSSSWLNNKENYLINLSTETYNTMWQVFSIYKIKTTSDYLKIEFNDKEFENFIKLIKDRSEYDFNTTVSSTDNVLTLSTCYNDDYKVVLHAKLIKMVKKDVN